jgi:hypothetical protein
MSEYIGYRDGGKTNEQGLFQWLRKLFTTGVPTVDSSTSWQVTQRGAGANMSVDIAAGDGSIGISTSNYNYWGFSDATKNKTVSAADPSNPRKDIVVAYVDLAVVDSSSNNNPLALKFAVVAGTPAGSPADPSDPTIQSAVGASNPWTKLARIAVAAGATSVVNANITDLRTPIAVKGRLWGGPNNTNGHTVPNVADDTVALLAATQSLTNKSLDSTNTLTNVTMRSMPGWIDANESWTYSSYDATNKTGVITVPTDATTKYSAGMRVRFTNNAATQYGIITKVTSTTLTVYFGTDYSLTNSAITVPYYATTAAPFGFPLDPAKWTVKTTLSGDYVKTSPTATTWYGDTGLTPTGPSISVPIGCFFLSHQQIAFYGQKATATSIDAYMTLSTANNSESDTELTAYNKLTGASATLLVQNSVSMRKAVTLTSATTYYLNVKTATATAGQIGTGGSLNGRIEAVCAYL